MFLLDFYLYRFILATLILTALSSCSSLPDNTKKTKSYAYSNTLDSKLGRHNKYVLKDKSSDASSLTVLQNGEDALVARIALARAAEKSLDLQYYHYHNDLTGKLLFVELWQAAERGVRVRLLLDDMGIETRDENLALIAQHPNLSIRVFNPFVRGKLRSFQYLSDFSRVTRRMHNKSFIADNQMAILGGRNIGDEYFGANPFAIFGDLDVIVSGESVRGISSAFDKFWNSEYAYPVELLASTIKTEPISQISEKLKNIHLQLRGHKYSKALVNSKLAKSLSTNSVETVMGDVSIIYDSPRKIEAEDELSKSHLVSKLIPVFKKVEKDLLIVSPYFIPGENGMGFIKSLRKKGVEVTILTNSLASQDVPIVFSAYSKYRKELLKIGVNLYELDPTTLGPLVKETRHSMTTRRKKVGLHAKFFLIDKNKSFIGSMNFDPRSVYKNTEIGIIIESEKLTNLLLKEFYRSIAAVAFNLKLVGEEIVWVKSKQSQEVNYFVEPYTSWWDRLTSCFMGILPIESQL